MDSLKKLFFDIASAELAAPTTPPKPNMPPPGNSIFEIPSPPAVPGAPAPAPSVGRGLGNQGASYGGSGQGSQTGQDPTDAIREGADRRGYHENFGKETHDNIGRFDSPDAGVVNPDFSLADSIAKGAEVLTEVAIGLSVGFLIWGALRMAMASGDEEQVEHAKGIMKWSIAGLVLSLIAFSMVTMVTKAVMSA